MHFVTLLYMPKRKFYLTLRTKFAIIDCDCHRQKETFVRSFAKSSQSPTSIASLKKQETKEVGQDILKGVYYALVLTF